MRRGPARGIGALGQTRPGDMIVGVPSALVVAGRALPAAHVIAAAKGDGYVRIFNQQTRGVFVPTHRALRTASDGSKLVFHRYGDTYFVSALWVTGIPPAGRCSARATSARWRHRKAWNWPSCARRNRVASSGLTRLRRCVVTTCLPGGSAARIKMVRMSNATPVVIAVLVAELAPAAAFGFAAERVARALGRWPVAVRVTFPALLVVPYVVIAVPQHIFLWPWFTLYAEQAAVADPEQRGNWRDALILLTLGLAVDLRWFDAAWPAGLRGLANLLLVDAGLYAFLGIRRLSGTGFDFHLHWSDWKTGLRELVFLAPPVLVLGIALGFLHPHANLPAAGKGALTWAGMFVFVAVPEELFFRAWVQNFLERRVARRAALAIASVLFGLSHFNKRSAHFNWRYILLATVAGIFYGRAWRERRRVPASAITHTCVDWLWSLWF
jgi:membrane protease YdiL (CAAX protease family)